MLKKIFAVALLATILVSCKSKSAFNFSEDIVKKERSLEPAVQNVEAKIDDFFRAGQFDSVAAAAEKMENSIQQKIDEIEAMKVPDAKEADNFKAASITYFKFMRSVYTKYKEIGKAESDEEKQKLVQEMQGMIKDKDKVISDMQAAQRKFASENGFKVQ